ncbi:MAG: hypothetical protein V7641_1575 [Blastocatellia bacterium]
MAKKIIAKLRAINAQVELELAEAKLANLEDPTISTESDLAKILSDLALQAIQGGRDSAAWKAYMRKIVGTDNPDSLQFKRLTFQDDLRGQDYVVKSNVYIVANAVCGSNTRTNTLANVETEGTDIIDKDLAAEA